MPILNYTSTISAAQSVGEIQERLAAHGATTITVNYEGREPAAITFTIPTKYGPQTYRLPANVDAIERILHNTRNATKTRAQAQRTAWRIIKDWVEAQVAIVEAEQASLDQIMLPYNVTASGATVYDAYVQHALQLSP